MTSYFITPFDPNINPNWDVKDIDLIIDSKYYQQQLLLKWPATKIIQSPIGSPLSWVMYKVLKDGQLESCGIGELDSGLQIVSVDTPYEEYFLWHRGLIPSRYRLFLFNESDITETLELKPETTIEIIEQYCGKQGF
jgi:hypothetical protein